MIFSCEAEKGMIMRVVINKVKTKWVHANHRMQWTRLLAEYHNIHNKTNIRNNKTNTNNNQTNNQTEKQT